MTIRRTLGALALGLALMLVTPGATEAAHRHRRGCGHSYVERYDHRPYDGRYYGGRYYDRYERYDGVDYDAPYVAHHGSGRYSGRYRYYRDDYGYRGRARPYYAPRDYGPRRTGYHFHGRSRCYRPHRPHIHFGIHLGF